MQQSSEMHEGDVKYTLQSGTETYTEFGKLPAVF